MKRILLLLLNVLAVAVPASAEIKTETITYEAKGTKLKGYLAYDDATKDKRPGVIVMPEWWGLTEYPKERAKQLAELGYVAFAADMYGDGKTTDDAAEAGKLSGEVKGNVEMRRAREKAAMKVLTGRKEVDKEQIGAIGFCFGGAIALDMTRAEMPVDGVVTFHGALATDTPAKKSEDIKTKVLVLHGADDPLVKPEEVSAFEDEMKNADIDFKVIKYPGAVHAFSNPDADRHNMPPIKYNKEAAEKSWAAMTDFFQDLFRTSK